MAKRKTKADQSASDNATAVMTAPTLDIQPPTYEGERIEQISVDQLFPSPFQTRKIRDDERLLELGRTIAAHGLIEPVCCRPIDDVKVLRDGATMSARYEIVAGHRRVRAARLAGLRSVLCLVRDLTDQQCREMIVLENLQREDLNPLEEAAGVLLLLEADAKTWTYETVASQIGRSERWVAERVRLNHLTEVWRDAYDDEKSPAYRWPVAHLVEVAKLPAEIQDGFFKLVKTQAGWRNRGFESVSRLRDELASYRHSLAAAPWDVKDAELLYSAGACMTCDKRTGHDPVLFADLLGETEKDRLRNDECMDTKCWESKQKAFVEVKQKELAAEHGKDLVLAGETHAAKNGKLPKGVVPKYERREVKPTAPGAKPTLIVNGSDAGRVIFTAPGGPASKPQRPVNEDGKPEPKPLSERRKEYARRRKAIALEMIRQAMDEVDACPADAVVMTGPTPAEVWRLALVFGTKDNEASVYGGAGKYLWNKFAESRKEPEFEIANQLWTQVRQVLQDRLTYAGPVTTSDRVDQIWEEAETMCATVHLRSEYYLEKATEKLPDPKGWAAEAAAERSKKAANKRKGA